MINEFRGKYYFLSNFYSAPVEWCGVKYLNNEAAFQSAKVISIDGRQQFAHLDPSKAKQKGRRVQLRYDWEKVKEQVMYEVCLAKFTQNEDLKRRLLETDNEYLEEGNTWGDREWGTCRGIGKNKLGKILMKIRDELRR